jgi:hypothetical protein
VAIYVVDRPSINNQAGALLRQLDNAFLRVQQFKGFLDTIPDATLISLYGYVQGDIDVLRSALSDVEQLRGIYQGASNLAVAKDFRAFAKQTYPYGSL